jgi:hypothetical protein
MPSSDNSHCHDDQCIQAPLCWRYTTRLTVKWASHVMTFREAQDRTGAQCTYFIPIREDDNRDNAR